MAKKDFYLVLGVPRTASEQTIKRAYRRLAKAHHPDRTGSEEAEGFQEVVEAYEVLSDAGRRQVYNESSPGAGTAPPQRGVAGSRRIVWDPARHVEPLVPPTRGVEPLIPEPLGALDDFRSIHCRGRGVVEERQAVRVHLPVATRDRVVELSLARLGIANLFLRLHVRIPPWP